MGECPAAGFGARWALFGAGNYLWWRLRLHQLMHQLQRPSAWPGDGWHSLDLKPSVLWDRKTPSQEWAGGKGAACPARGSVSWCVPLHNCYTKEGAVLGPTVPCLFSNCELSGTT